MINPNTAFENELYFKFLNDPESVSPEWRKYFANYVPPAELDELPGAAQPTPSHQSPIVHEPEPAVVHSFSEKPYSPARGDEVEYLPSIFARVAENMSQSLSIPTATSFRSIPVKPLDENRRIVNKYLARMKRNKVSFTHILAWALVRALTKFPNMNACFAEVDGKPCRVRKPSINIGLAVDVTRSDGSRMLMVPNIKNAETLNFSDFIKEYDKIINKARTNKIAPEDLQQTTMTLTNPGMIGTTSSQARLMNGQGLIVASGSIDYPAEFQAVRPELLTRMAVSKVVSLSSTYDHRIIQGAESAEFLAYVSKLLLGEDRFYDHIFATLKIPFEPIRWERDSGSGSITKDDDTSEKSAHVMQLINAFRVRGHLLATINPLGFESYYYPETDPAYYGFTIWDLDRVFHVDDAWKSNNMPLRDVIELLRDTYCGTSGFEFMHIQDAARKSWVKEYLELGKYRKKYPRESKLRILEKLTKVEEFENFLHTKFVGHKRFSLEGGESLVVLLEELMEQSSDSGHKDFMLGMPHRGRLSVLVNSVGKPKEKVFSEFDGKIDSVSYHGSGDVKYHLGAKGVFHAPSGNSIKITLANNPSHLELVNPVVEGMARASNDESNSIRAAIPVLIHGDSAFAGQGIVQETLNLSQLSAYNTGGTIHIIINNQIGFTTTADKYRSTVYSTDVAKMIQVPIIHVNGHDPEAVVDAARFAFDYREKFSSDVVIDMLCYRKYGHNEADEPSYTQPLLYKKIRSMQSVVEKYRNELIAEGEITEEEAHDILERTKNELNRAFDERDSIGAVQEINAPIESAQFDSNAPFGEELLFEVGKVISEVPERNDFATNPKVASLIKKRKDSLSGEGAIDWATAEALAFGSLLTAGINIRFTGEDTRRGTFSQRHSVLTSVENEEEYTPLNHIRAGQATLQIFDSPLSELGVLGFEYGYSVQARETLTLWEAQFGDFANMAQPIFDQFLSCGESKWNQTSNLAVLLPHSYDGQGPEHSSARLERFLQLSAEDNMRVCNLTTPAQYFHAIRRQATTHNRKPLVLMTPKSMLRNHLALSKISDFTEKQFATVLDFDFPQNRDEAERIVFCSGKLYFELLEEYLKSGKSNTAIIRLEQLYPFDTESIRCILSSCPNAKEFIWAQEEPKNMGAWGFVFMQFAENLPEIMLRYAGRRSSPATATGSLKVHQQEQSELIKDALIS